MKKTILAVSALFLLFSLNMALAKNEPNGGPFQAIWSAITGLQNQIDEIALTPGEPGAPGQDGLNCWDLNGNGLADPEEDINGDSEHNALDCQGAPGPQGEKGDPGEPGTSLTVEDANGQYLGILLNSSLYAHIFTTYLPEKDVILHLSQKITENRGEVIFDIEDTAYFLNENCVGEPYTQTVGFPGGIVGIKNLNKFYRFIEDEGTNGLRPKSYLEHTGCVNGTPGVGTLYRVEEFTLPFSIPLAWPLQIVAQ